MKRDEETVIVKFTYWLGSDGVAYQWDGEKITPCFQLIKVTSNDEED